MKSISILETAASTLRLRKIVPDSLKGLAKNWIPYVNYRIGQLQKEAEDLLGGSIPTVSDYDSPFSIKVGILYDTGYTFAFNVAACRFLRVQFEVIDLLANNWIELVEDSECDVFFATPPTLRRIWRSVFEERLRFLSEDMKRKICPTFQELYLWESKRRMRDWLVIHKVPHPETSVFFGREDAMEFINRIEYPIVCKMDSGAASSGVFVFCDENSASRMVKKAFGRGISRKNSGKGEAEIGMILFQEYIEHDCEWRIARIGDAYFCRKKGKSGAFASGSGDIEWARPPTDMLEFARVTTEIVGFRHMSVDVFENPRGEEGCPYLVNEMQAIIGFRDVPANENTGRWLYDPRKQRWLFEGGEFHQDALAVERLKMVLKDFGEL